MLKHKLQYFKIAYQVRIVYSSVIQFLEGEYFFSSHRAGQEIWGTGNIPKSAYTKYGDIRRNVINHVQGSSITTLLPSPLKNTNVYLAPEFLILGRYWLKD